MQNLIRAFLTEHIVAVRAQVLESPRNFLPQAPEGFYHVALHLRKLSVLVDRLWASRERTPQLGSQDFAMSNKNDMEADKLLGGALFRSSSPRSALKSL